MNVTPVTTDLADDQNDLAASLFFDHLGAARIAWSSTHFGDPTEDIVQMPVADRATYPSQARLLTSTLGTADHSPRIVALTIEGRQVYVMIWVRIAAPITMPAINQVVYRVFSEL